MKILMSLSIFLIFVFPATSQVSLSRLKSFCDDDITYSIEWLEKNGYHYGETKESSGAKRYTYTKLVTVGGVKAVREILIFDNLKIVVIATQNEADYKLQKNTILSEKYQIVKDSTDLNISEEGKNALGGGYNFNKGLYFDTSPALIYKLTSGYILSSFTNVMGDIRTYNLLLLSKDYFEK